MRAARQRVCLAPSDGACTHVKEELSAGFSLFRRLDALTFREAVDDGLRLETRVVGEIVAVVPF